MKTILAFIVLIFLSSFGWSQPKYVLAGKTAPAEITVPEWMKCTELKTSDPAVVIKSFTIRFVMYDRNMEIVSTSGAFTEEMYEGIELLSQQTNDPREFYIDNVEATRDGKSVKLPQHKIKLK
jgi:hypothetical protein